jgi:hypothetical protein
MAMYHLHAHFFQRSKKQSSVAAAAYRAGEKLVDERKGSTLDFRHKTHVEHKEILLPDHVPDELLDRGTLWNRVEAQLGRKDGQPAFEVEVALPRELSHEQCAELARSFAQDHFVSEGLIVDLCIHRGVAADGGEHPHAHMMITTRTWNEDGSMGRKHTGKEDNPRLIKHIYHLEKQGRIDEALVKSKGTNLAKWRKSWADYSNDFLERAGEVDRVDHRTLAAQRIDREATPNIGVAFHRGLDNLDNWLARKVEAFKDIGWRNKLRNQFDRIRSTRKDLTAEFIANAREYAKDLVADLEPKKERGADHER